MDNSPNPVLLNKIIQDHKPKKLYIDIPKWEADIKVDSFLVAEGKTKTNSVYHVAEVKVKDSPKHTRMKRCHLVVYKTDLLTACKRDRDQELIPFQWYKRDKKNA